MAMGSQQLAEDYGQLKDLLELYPHITITKTEGQPPDNYEIEFDLKGYVKEADGRITIGKKHLIRISLPFGYPHFAPIVKPLSSIFHPDIDPAAVRIAEQWQKNPSLPDLVLHIGEMICGTIYNLDDPFSQEAAEWYKAHEDQLPLDALSVADIEGSDEDLDSFADDHLDALVDDTFASLGLESDDFLEPDPTPVGPSKEESQIKELRQLLAEKKIHAAHQLLSELPEDLHFADRADIQEKIGKIFRKTDQLFKLAEQLEDMGKLDEALEVADNLFDLAVDLPGGDALRNRIQESHMISSSFATPNLPHSFEEDLEAPLKQDQPKKKPPAEKKKKEPRKPFLMPLLKAEIPYRFLILIILILGLSIGGISLYFKDQNLISETKNTVVKAQLLIDNKQFDQALDTLESTRSSLGGLTILRVHKQALVDELNALINSDTLQEGLKGRILYQGKYIPSMTADALSELKTLIEQAKHLATQEKLDAAISLYQQALQFAEEQKLEADQAAIKDDIKALTLKRTLASAKKAENAADWDAAAEAYRKALEISGDVSDLGTIGEITHRLTAATFRHELDQSKKAFTQAQWQNTIESLEKAQRAINANPSVVTDKERKDLDKLLLNAQLYKLLSAAKEAYQDKNWEQAATDYREALQMLKGHSEQMGNQLGDSVTKIEKTLFMVEVAQIQDQVLIAESNNDGETVLHRGNQILKKINNSKFAADPDVQTIKKKMAKAIAKRQTQVDLKEKIAYIEEHFEEIFRANYPTFRGSKLYRPKAELLRQVDDKMIFAVTCLERSQGSTSKLELNYMFNGSTGKWSVYNQ